MELKEARYYSSPNAAYRLNCTFMELKVGYLDILTLKQTGLNCTFMELKENKE